MEHRWALLPSPLFRGEALGVRGLAQCFDWSFRWDRKGQSLNFATDRSNPWSTVLQQYAFRLKSQQLDRVWYRAA
jgi:hypothetical protein